MAPLHSNSIQDLLTWQWESRLHDQKYSSHGVWSCRCRCLKQSALQCLKYQTLWMVRAALSEATLRFNVCSIEADALVKHYNWLVLRPDTWGFCASDSGWSKALYHHPFPPQHFSIFVGDFTSCGNADSPILICAWCYMMAPVLWYRLFAIICPVTVLTTVRLCMYCLRSFL